MNKEIEDNRWQVSKDDGLTDIQRNILEHYYNTFSVTKACEFAGVDKSYLYHSIKKKTPFAARFRELTKELETDPRVTKVGSIGTLLDIQERARLDGDYATELKVQIEINKMIDKNLAVQKKSVETVNLDVRATLDLTRDKQDELAESQTDDVEYIDIEAEETDDRD